ELGEHLETTARQLEPALHRLITIGDSAHRNNLRFPFRGRKLCAQKFGGILFYHDFTLEIQSGGKAEILMEWPGITINAAMLAAPIGINAGGKANIRTVVVGNNRA